MYGSYCTSVLLVVGGCDSVFVSFGLGLRVPVCCLEQLAVLVACTVCIHCRVVDENVCVVHVFVGAVRVFV